MVALAESPQIFYKSRPRNRCELFSTLLVDRLETAVEAARRAIMVRLASFVALCMALSCCSWAQSVESMPAPPNWQDGQGPSVYLTQCQSTGGCSNCNKPMELTVPHEAVSTNEPPRYERSAIVQASHELPVPTNDSTGRRLAPPSSRGELPSDQHGHTSSAQRIISSALPTAAIYTVGTALVIVIGAFLLFTWAMRRGSTSAKARRGMVPNEAVSVLGRVPLAARQFAELLHIGNKLVLVAVTPSGPSTITEVIDPAEVDRLVGLCRQYDPHSTTKAFEQVFQQLSNEPTSSGFLGNEPLPTSLSSAALSYRSQRGTARA